MTFEPTDHEAKLLRYLHQRGPTERRTILIDCASDNSMIGSRRNLSKTGAAFYNGSNGAAPMIVARWMRRLVGAGYVKEKRRQLGLHDHYRLTEQGEKFVREGLGPQSQS